MTDGFDGRTAVVTGGSRGIGLAVVRALLARGASVILTSRSEESARAVAEGLGSERVRGFGAHSADPDAAQACADFALSTFGSLDVLVNNAGTNPAYGPVVDQDRGRFLKTLEVNLWAPALWTGVAWRAWMREHGGVVVNVASVGAYLAAPGLGVYGASKAALVHLTRQLAAELAPGVRVTAVAPGVVRTALSRALWEGREGAAGSATLLGRTGRVEEVADAVCWLASAGAGWVTGETLVLDGGERIVGPRIAAGPG
ncbi:SDR family oxidoreductase [Pseudonocardia sp. ICBG1293]|uniref:SDR family oxidoreductase n=1 Tax=Pseudonocardia sp. ICBG1293 TaxID=2844382 RepID=UPI001CCA7B77|nr:SDR family oxidoreductase [Pseudonocardia sp. ICBG1293]